MSLEEKWSAIAELHKQVPAMRMGQFLENIFSELGDAFYLPDEQFLERIKEIVGKWQ